MEDKSKKNGRPCKIKKREVLHYLALLKLLKWFIVVGFCGWSACHSKFEQSYNVVSTTAQGAPISSHFTNKHGQQIYFNENGRRSFKLTIRMMAPTQSHDRKKRNGSALWWKGGNIFLIFLTAYANIFVVVHWHT